MNTLPLLAAFCLSVAFALTGNRAEAQEVTVSQLEANYYARDYQRIDEILSQRKRPLTIDEQLLKLAVAVQRDKDDVEAALTSFVQQHGANAKVQYWAGQLWLTIARRSSIFGKMSKFSRYVNAMTTAANLAPDNARYQMEAAKAYGQPSMMGGDPDQQQPIVEKLQPTQSPFARIAYMDYLQNTQNKSQGIEYAIEMTKAYATNVEVVERAGQLMWTFENKSMAGQAFWQACQLPVGEREALIKWETACWLVATFSLSGNMSLDDGIQAAERLLVHSRVYDTEYQDNLFLLAQLLEKNAEKAKAIATYNELLKLSSDRVLKNKVKKEIRKLTKH
ncbi:hypothetical protein [Thalassotalea fusca]